MRKDEKEVLQYQLDSEKAILKELEKQYKAALEAIDEKVAALLGRSDANLQHVIFQIEHQKALRRQIEGVLNQLHSNEFDTISDYLANCYEDGFIGSMYSMHNQGIPVIVPIDQNEVTKAVVLDSKINEGLYESIGVDVGKMKKSIRSEITRGISAGMSYNEIARNISKATKAPLSRAKTIVYTEGHRVQQASNYDGQRKAKSKGADVVKQWNSILDGNTRPTHRKLDGQIREVEEPFEMDGKKAMYPGEFGDPAEDCNCRCVSMTRAKWALDEEELQTLKDRAEYFGLDKSESFADFKKKYLRSLEKVASKTTSTIREKMFSPAKTLDEAEKFIKPYVEENKFGAVGVSYKGIDIDVANVLNKRITLLLDTYDVGKIGGIIAPAGNTKLGKMINGATAAYSPVRDSFLLNRNSMKNIKTAMKAFEAETEAITNLLNHPQKYDFTKLSSRVRKVVERSKVSGRATVPTTIEEAIDHEFGHKLEKYVYKSELWEEAAKNMGKYADKLSGYAGENKSEYIAESFASYMKGETVADPVMINIFESLKR